MDIVLRPHLGWMAGNSKCGDAPESVLEVELAILGGADEPINEFLLMSPPANSCYIGPCP